MKRILYLLVSILSVQSVFADDVGHMMYPGTGHMFWNFGFIGLFVMILFLAGVIFLTYWLITRFNEGRQTSHHPVDILKRRYAKGEITKSEYEKKRDELET